MCPWEKAKSIYIYIYICIYIYIPNMRIYANHFRVFIYAKDPEGMRVPVVPIGTHLPLGDKSEIKKIIGLHVSP